MTGASTRRERVAGLLARIGKARADMAAATDELALLAQLGELSGAAELAREYEAALDAHRATIKSQSDDLAAAWQERDRLAARLAAVESAAGQAEAIAAELAELKKAYADQLQRANNLTRDLATQANELADAKAQASKLRERAEIAEKKLAALPAAPAYPLEQGAWKSATNPGPVPARPQPRRAFSTPACATCKFGEKNEHAEKGWACRNRANECLPDVFNYRYEYRPSQPAR